LVVTVAEHVGVEVLGEQVEAQSLWPK